MSPPEAMERRPCRQVWDSIGTDRHRILGSKPFAQGTILQGLCQV